MFVFQKTCKIAHSLTDFPLSLTVDDDVVAAVNYSGAETCSFLWESVLFWGQELSWDGTSACEFGSDDRDCLGILLSKDYTLL